MFERTRRFLHRLAAAGDASAEDRRNWERIPSRGEETIGLSYRAQPA